MASLKKFNGSTWVDSKLRKLDTATDTLTTLPAVVYPTSTTATVGLKGQAVQNGTPTPDNPIMPQGTGERTGNLFDKSTAISGERILANSVVADATVAHSDYIDVTGISNLTVSHKYTGTNFYFYSNKTNASIGYVNGYTADVPTGAKYCRINIQIEDLNNTMLNLGSTPLPYEPYGYKLTISSANTTTPIYLGEVETTRKIYKYAFTGQETEWRITGTGRMACVLPTTSLKSQAVSCICSHYIGVGTSSIGGINNGECSTNTTNNEYVVYDTNYTTIADFESYLAAQYANGTPVTVWYVLATPETAVVNEPLMKIGGYADEVSNISIPVTAGGDSVDVETTVKPSEVSLAYTGWHDTEVIEIT